MKASFQNSLFFISQDKQQLITKIRGAVLSSSLEIREILKNGRPTFVTDKKPVAFICAKNDTDYVELGFFKAIYLNDSKNLFNGKAKEIRRIRIKAIDDIPVLQIKRWMREAIRLDP